MIQVFQFKFPLQLTVITLWAKERNDAVTGIAKFTGVVKDTVEKLESDDGKDDDHKQHQ